MTASIFGDEGKSVQQFAIGEHVSVSYENTLRVTGKVLEVRGGQCLIRFDQGIVVIERFRETFWIFPSFFSESTLVKIVPQEWFNMSSVSPAHV